MRNRRIGRTVLAASALSALAAAAVTLALVAGPGSAAGRAAPSNTSPPTISGTPGVGQTLTASRGTWTGNPTAYGYRWLRCDENGGSCSGISGATDRTYTLKAVDAGNTLRVRVTARNSDGSTSATSVPTAVVKAQPKPPATGCPSGDFALVNDVGPPARLTIDRVDFSPSVITRSTHAVIARFHVVDTCNQPVQGALVYGTAVPFNQLSVEEQPTGKDGWAELDFHVLSSFPLSSKQGLLVVFARARKPGDNLLAGVSTRRLVSLRAQV